jgi:signal transduction histidine kinase/CHASE2 domain-containing sensor protein
MEHVDTGPAPSLDGARESAWRVRARWELCGFSLLAVLLMAGLLLAGGVPALDRPVRDALLAATARPPDPRIVLVTVSDSSLQSAGAWPWSWERHAQLLTAICAQRPAAVGLDLLLADLPQGGEAEVASLANALRRCGNVVLAMSAHASGREASVLPLPALERAAAGVGHAHVVLAGDGVAREVPARVQLGDRVWVPLFTEMLRVAHEGAARGPAKAQSAAQNALLAPVRGAIKAIDYQDLLRPAAAEPALAGKYVLVGVTATGLGSFHALPAWGAPRTVSSVELVAVALSNALQAHPVRDAPRALVLAFNALVLAGVVLTLAFVSPARVLAACLVLAVLASLGAAALVAHSGLLVNPATGILVGLVVFPLWYWRKLSSLLRYLAAETLRLQREWGLEPAALARHRGVDVESHIHALESSVRQLRSLHGFLRGIVLGLPDASMVVDPGGRVVLANIAAARYFCSGGAHALQGRHFDELMSGLHVQAAARHPIRLADLPRAGEQLNLDVLGRDGREMLLRSVAFHEHASDRQRGWIVTLVDVFELRALERARDEAFSFISHDMRSPQASILALIELYKRGGDEGGAQALLPRIEAYARDSMELAEDFVLSLRARTAPFTPRVLDLADLCETSVRELRPQALARRQALRCEQLFEAAPAFVSGETRLLRRALDNLVGNALKFSPNGARVIVQISRAGACWKVSVLDEGPGIDEKLRVAIFDRYYQAERAQQLPRGAGLGLDFVRIVAARHQGCVRASALPQGGSVFELELPVLELDDEEQDNAAWEMVALAADHPSV